MAFIAYIDCSGDSNDPRARVVTVGGYLAPEEHWESLERRWGRVLNDFKVPYLHMREFAHSRGAYEGWRDDVGRRNAFMAQIAAAINDSGLQSFSTTVLLSVYNRFNREYRLREALGAPYALGLLKTLAEIVSWRDRHGRSDALIPIIESGDNDQREFTRVLGRLGEWDIGPAKRPVFQAKRWKDERGAVQYCIPMQSADFIVYESAKAATDYFWKNKRIARRSLFSVAYPPKGEARMNQVLSPEFLRQTVRTFRVLRRYNRASDGVSMMPADPLCYLGMDQPLVCTVSPENLCRPAQKAAVEALGPVL